MELKQLREPQPNKVSFRTIRFSRKNHQKVNKVIVNILEDQITSGTFNTKKGESYKENICVALLEQEPKVLNYLHQAVPPNKDGKFKPLEYRRKDGVIEEWIPDFAVVWNHRKPMIIEVKTKQYLLNNKEKLSHKWLESGKYAQENGWDFYVFTDEFASRSWRVDNIFDLESQLWFKDSSCERTILDCFNTKKEWTIKALQVHLHSVYPKNVILASTFNLIYCNCLFINFDEEFTLLTHITSNPLKLVPLDEWFERYSWKKLIKQVEPNHSLPVIDKDEISLKKLEKFERDKKIVKDRLKGMSYKEIAEKYQVPISTMGDIWHRSEKGTNLEALLRKKGSGRKRHRLFKIDENNQPIFLDCEFGKAIEFYEQAERPIKDQCWRKYKHEKRVVALTHGWITRANENYVTMKKVCPQGFLASKDIFFRELNCYETKFRKRILIRREGYKKASKLTQCISGSTPHMNYIGQMCQIDHSSADILGVNPISIFFEHLQKQSGHRIRAHFDKAMITVVLDVYTRCILGYAFRYRKPSRESTFLAIRRTVLGKINPLLNEKKQNDMKTTKKILRAHKQMYQLGLISEQTLKIVKEELEGNLGAIADWWDNLRVMPRTIHSDNGADFDSKDFKSWAKEYHVSISYRPVGGSQYGGHVERVLGTLNRAAFDSIPGSTKGDITRRGDYDSEGRAILMFEHIEAIFLLEVLRYHCRVHSKLGIPPIEAWKQAIERGDNLTFLFTYDDKGREEIRKFNYNTLPRVTRTYTKEGISIDSIKYNYVEYLSNTNDISWVGLYKLGDSIAIRRDTQDIRYVWWWNSRLKHAVRVWATEISLGGGKKYNRDQLKRMLPISLLQYHDMRSEIQLKIGLEQILIHERTINSLDNIRFSVKQDLPRTKKETQKVLRKIGGMLEHSRIAIQEVNETTGYIAEEIPKVRLFTSREALPPGELKEEEDDHIDEEEGEDEEIEGFPTEWNEVKKTMIYGSWREEEDIE